MFHHIPLFFAGIEEIITIAYYAFVAASVVYTINAAQQAKKAAADAAKRGQGLLYQVRATAEPRRIPYGKVRLGGIECFVASSGGGNEFLQYILIWGEGPVKSIDKFLFDDVEVPLDSLGNATNQYGVKVHVEHKLGGDDNLTPIGGAVAQMPGWSATDLNLGIAYSWVYLEYDATLFPNGVPSMSVVLQGCTEVLDPRISTSGSDLVYSTNVALCCNHYLTQARVGPGIDYTSGIKESVMIDSANICDEQVGSTADGFEERYSFNGVIVLSDKTEDIVQQFRDAMAGVITYVQGRWYIYAGAYAAPTFEITPSMIVGKITLQTKVTKANNFNTVKGSCSLEEKDWQPTDYPAYSESEWLAADGEELLLDLDLPNSRTINMCRRVAAITLRKARFSKQLTLQCSIEAIRATPGRPVMFTFPEFGFDMTPMDVNEYSLGFDGGALVVNLSLRQTGPAVYDAPDYYFDSGFVGAPGVVGRPTDLPIPGDSGPPLTYWDLMTVVTGSSSYIECKTQGGDAQLVGCPSYTAIATPPKRWRRIEASGCHGSMGYNDSGCTMPSGDPSVTCCYPNWLQWNAADGTTTTGGQGTCNGGPIGSPGFSGCPSPNSSSCTETITHTETQEMRANTTNCCASGITPPYFKAFGTNSLVYTLSDEDTEADALVRLKATFEDWDATGFDWSPCDDFPENACCYSWWYNRGDTDIDFAYQEARAHVHVTGLVVVNAYVVLKVEIWQIDLVTMEASLYSTEMYESTVDMSGAADWEFNLPNVQGFSFYVANYAFYGFT